MGAAASVYLSDQNIPESLKTAFRRNEALKLQIAQKDAQFIFAQSEENWIDHKSLIKLLCERSKAQLHQIAEVYQKSPAHGHIPHLSFSLFVCPHRLSFTQAVTVSILNKNLLISLVDPMVILFVTVS
jgi:indole-3-glycerol phosphate synthase